MLDENIFLRVEKNIDDLVDNKVDFSISVTHEEIEKFKTDGTNPCRFFMPPEEWLPKEMSAKKVLCLAGAGGQQAPLFAAIGADVTVIDLSSKMLEQDKIVAKRENMSLQVEHGNICDLSRFPDEFFDIIINPASLMYIPNIEIVFNECSRILKRGGKLIVNAPNPINYVCEYSKSIDDYIACNKLPYISYEHDEQGDWIEYGHTLENYIGGQIKYGFMIVGFYEDRKKEPIETYFTTCAVRQ